MNAMLRSKVARIEARISELDFEIKKKKIMEEYERKQQELGKRLRNAAKKLNDAELKEKLLFEADLLEKKAGNRQLSARDQLKRAQYTLQQRLEEQLEPLLVNNTDKLLKLEDKVPLLKGRLYKKEIKDDAEYVTFPLFGGMIVEKQKLNVAQVAVGGVFAGAFGEVIKDAISFPVDTVRTRLMTAGSFRDPTPADTSDSASAPRVDQKGSQWEARREELTFGTRREVLAAKRQQLAGERGGRDRGVESEGEQVRLGAKLPVPLDLGARLMVYKEDIERGTMTFVRNTSKQARTAIVAWGRRRWYEALVRVRASPDWQRLRQLRAELQEDRRWLAAERGIATTVAVTSTIIRRATVPLQQRLQRFSAPVGIFNDVYRGVAPVLLASPFQGALFFGVKDTIKKGLPMLGANPELTFIAGVVVADSAYWLVRCPAETVKTRVQTGVDQNMVQSIKKILQTEGLYGFYRGYLPLLQLDFPFAAVQLALFSTYIGLVPAVFGHDAAMLDQFVGGFVCSAFTAAVTCPLSVASTRILLDAGGGAKNAGQVEVDIVKDLGELESRLAEKAADDFGKAKEAVVNVEKGLESAFESATSAPRTGTRTIEQEGGQTEAEGESEQPTEDGDEPGLFLPGPVQVKAGEGTQIVSRMPPQSPLPTNTAALAGDSGEETDKAAGKTTHRQQRDVPPPPPLPPLQQGKPEGGRGKLDASIEERALLYQWRRQRRGGAQKTPRAEGGLSEDESTKTLLRRAAQPATAVPAKGAEGPRKGWDRQPKYKNMLQTIKLIATEEGVGALFKGVVPRVLQLGLNHAIRFTGYQVRPSADVRVCALAVRACACLCVHVCVGRRSCAAGTRDACPPHAPAWREDEVSSGSNAHELCVPVNTQRAGGGYDGAKLTAQAALWFTLPAWLTPGIGVESSRELN